MDASTRALFEEGLTRFTGDHYADSKWFDHLGQPQGYSRPLYERMAELGWLELDGAEDEDSEGIADLLPLLIEAGRGLWREPLGAVLGEPIAVARHADDPVRGAELMQRWTSGQIIPAWAHREPGCGWMCQLPEASARETGLGFELSGTKSFVLHADTADEFVVSAMAEDNSGPAFFLVQADAPGLHIECFDTVDDRRAANLKMRDAAAELIASGCSALEAARQRAVLLTAAEAIGIMQAVCQHTARYLQERKQFGRPLASFQALQHRFVEMHMQQVESSALLWACAQAFAAASSDLETRMLQLQAQVAAALDHITREAVQMHGGMGVTHEMRIGHYYKRGLMLTSLHGSADWAMEQLATA